MYHVYFFVFHNPTELEERLNQVCSDKRLKLIAVCEGYFIFEEIKQDEKCEEASFID